MCRGEPYVSGHGTLKMSAQIRVMRNLLGGGRIDLYYVFYFSDWFIDVLDPANRFRDDVWGYWDYDNGVPFEIEGSWTDWEGEEIDTGGNVVADK
jgi:hypothetical protein